MKNLSNVQELEFKVFIVRSIRLDIFKGYPEYSPPKQVRPIHLFDIVDLVFLNLDEPENWAKPHVIIQSTIIKIILGESTGERTKLYERKARSHDQKCVKYVYISFLVIPKFGYCFLKKHFFIDV